MFAPTISPLRSLLSAVVRGRPRPLAQRDFGGMEVRSGAAAPVTAAAASTQSAPKSREYPDEPRVGVGVVVLRKPSSSGPEVLLIQRAKEPAKGLWCFAGGSLELGETMAECAVREIQEETGLRLLNSPGAPREACQGFSAELATPQPFSAVDAITRDSQGGLRFHYVVVEVVALAADPFGATPVANDDVSAVRWVPVSALQGMGAQLVPHCARLAEEAVARFTPP